MTPTAPSLADADDRPGYRHEAFLWDSPDEFLAVTVPFVREALDDGQRVMVALVDDQWEPLRQALGRRSARVRHVDIAEVGRNPARMIPVWRAFVAEDDRPLRGIGGSHWAGRRPEEVVEAQVHEALLNLALPARTELRLLCPYDAAALDPDTLDQVLRHHPELRQRGVSAPSTAWGGVDGARVLTDHPLERAPRDAERLTFAPGRLADVRRLATRHALRAGLAPDRADDLALAVSEVASNSIDHGGGGGVVRVWRDGAAFVLQVTDAGRLADPLAGRAVPAPLQERGRGLWMVNALCDLVQIRTTSTGTVVRLITWL